MPISPAGRGRSLRRRPSDSVMAQPCEKPATNACERSKPYWAQASSSRSSTASTDENSSGPALGMPSVRYHSQPDMNGSGARGRTVRNRPSGSRLGISGSRSSSLAPLP